MKIFLILLIPAVLLDVFISQEAMSEVYTYEELLERSRKMELSQISCKDKLKDGPFTYRGKPFDNYEAARRARLEDGPQGVGRHIYGGGYPLLEND